MLRRRGPYANLGGTGRPFGRAHRGDGRGRLGAQGADRRRDGRDEAAGRRGDGPGRDRARRLLFAEPFRLWRRADAVDDQRHRRSSTRWSARWAGPAAASSRSPRARTRSRPMEEIAARHGRRIFMSTGVGALQRAVSRRARSACSTPAPPRRRAATSSTSRSPASRCRSISRWPAPIRSTAIRPSTRSRPMTASS